MWCGTLCGAHEAETLTLAQGQVPGPVQGPLELEPQQVLLEQEPQQVLLEQELELALH